MYKTRLPKIIQNGVLYNIADLLGQTMIANEDTRLYRYPSTQEKIYSIDNLKDLEGKAFVYSTYNNVSIYKAAPNSFYDLDANKKPITILTRGANKQLGVFKGFKKGGGIYFMRDAILYYINSIDNTAYYFGTGNYSRKNNFITTIKRGQSIGELYSYARGLQQGYTPSLKRLWSTPTDDFFLTFKINGVPTYAKVTSEMIDTKALEEQGIKTTAEQNVTNWEKIQKGLKQAFIFGGILFAGVALTKAFIMSKAAKQ